jgi:hypothetical protein
MGLRRKNDFIFLMMGERVLIGCFPSHLSWCNNPNYQFLSGGHKGAGLHLLLIQVIIVEVIVEESVLHTVIA